MRLFLEIPLPDGLKDRAIAIAEQFRPLVDATFVKKDNLHLTLKFLGEVPEKKIPAIKDALSKISSPLFELDISGVGTFPTPYSVRVLWFGAGKGAKEFIELQKKLDVEIAPLKFPPEKSYVPHLTFARVKRVLDKAKLRELIEHNHHTFDVGAFTASNFRLMKSALTPKGPEYDEVSSFKLG